MLGGRGWTWHLLLLCSWRSLSRISVLHDHSEISKLLSLSFAPGVFQTAASKLYLHKAAVPKTLLITLQFIGNPHNKK